jgi:hypothetical protein
LVEFRSVSVIISPTGRPPWYDSPKSNVTIPLSRSRYCSIRGRSVPNRLLRASTDSWGANGPRIERPTSWGRTFEIVKTMTLRRSRVTIARARRRTMKATMIV